MSYFVKHSGKLYGPFSLEQLTANISCDLFTDKDQVSEDQMEWEDIGDFKARKRPLTVMPLAGGTMPKAPTALRSVAVPVAVPAEAGYEPAPQKQTSTASLVLGVLSVIFWLLPIIGFPIAVVGLILGIRKKYVAGIVLNSIGLALSIVNAVIGAIIAVKGLSFL